MQGADINTGRAVTLELAGHNAVEDRVADPQCRVLFQLSVDRLATGGTLAGAGAASHMRLLSMLLARKSQISCCWLVPLTRRLPVGKVVFSAPLHGRRRAFC